MTLDKTGVTEVFTFLGVSNFRNWGDAAAHPLDRYHRRPVGQVENMTDRTSNPRRSHTYETEVRLAQ